MTIGVLGLGLMGSALAERLLAAGYSVIGFDVLPAARERAVGLGALARNSAQAIFAEAKSVVLSLPTTNEVRQVLVQAGDFPNGTCIIDTTTGDPNATQEIGESLGRRGVAYIDATLTGSSRDARDGNLVVTAGGKREVFEQCEPIFRSFARQWFHVGPWGSGARIKLVVNLVLGLHRAVLAEGLAFAGKCGLDLGIVLDVLCSGAAYSRAMDVKGPRMIARNFTPDARLSQHLKDVRLILEAARQAEAYTPLSALHEQLLGELVSRGFGEMDNSAVIRAFDGSGP